MASRRRYSAAKARRNGSTHRKPDSFLLPSTDHSAHNADGSYRTISDLLSLYGIDAQGLEESFRGNKTAFAEAVVDRYYKRERRSGLLHDRELVELVDIRELVFGDEDEPLGAIPEVLSAVDHIPAESTYLVSINETPERETEVEVNSEGNATPMASAMVAEIDLFEYSQDDVVPEGKANVSTPQEECKCEEDMIDAHEDVLYADEELNESLIEEANEVVTEHVAEPVEPLSEAEKICTCDQMDEEISVENAAHKIDLFMLDKEDNEPASTEASNVTDITDEAIIGSCVAVSSDGPDRGPADGYIDEVSIPAVIMTSDDSVSLEATVTEDQESTAEQDDMIPEPCADNDQEPLLFDEELTKASEEDTEKLTDGNHQEIFSKEGELQSIVNDIVDEHNPAGSHEPLVSSTEAIKPCNVIAEERPQAIIDPVTSVTEVVAVDTIELEDPVDKEPETEEVEITTPVECAYHEPQLGTPEDNEDGQVLEQVDMDIEEMDSQETQSTEATAANDESVEPEIESVVEEICVTGLMQGPHVTEIVEEVQLPTIEEVIQPVALDGSGDNQQESGEQMQLENSTEEPATTESRDTVNSLASYRSIGDDDAENVASTDFVTARQSELQTVLSMVASVETFRENIYHVQGLIGALNATDLDELRREVEASLQTASQNPSCDPCYLVFLLILFVEMSHRDPIKLALFVQLVKQVSTDIISCLVPEMVYLYSIFLHTLGHALSKEFSFEVAKPLVDTLVGLAFQLQDQDNPLYVSLNLVLRLSADKCNSVEEYSSILHTVITRVGDGATHSSLITHMLLRIYQLMLSSVSMDNPFHELRGAIHKLVDVCLPSNFQFLKDLVDQLIKEQNDIVSHFVLLFIAKLMMGYYRQEKLPVIQKRRCLRILQIIAVPVFGILNDVEASCGFIQQYVACFSSNAPTLFKLEVFDLSLLEGCGRSDFPSKTNKFDEQALRNSSKAYMEHLDAGVLRDGRISDLVFLLSLKHVARRLTGTDPQARNGKDERRLNRESRYGTEMDPMHIIDPDTIISSRRESVACNLPLQEGTSLESSARSVQEELYQSTHDRETAKEVEVSVVGDCFQISRSRATKHELGNNGYGSQTLDGNQKDDGVLRYARIVWRLFSATRGKGIDDPMHPDIAQYLLIPAHRMVILKDIGDAELCYKLILYHVYNEIFPSIWRTMSNVLYSTNEYSQLASASSFLYKAITQRFEYLRYRIVRNLVVACLGDQCYMVRLTAVKILAELFQKQATADELISDVLMDKILVSMRDVNWKVRLAATTAVLHYVRRSGINMQVMPAVSALAERSSDIDKEHPSVKQVILDTLAFSLFCTGHPFFAISGGLDSSIVTLTERFVKVILYKISAFKVKENQIERVLNHYRQHFLEVEGKLDSSFFQNMPKDELQQLVSIHTKNALDKWMNLLLDLFLLRRSEGASFHVLAEVLCVLKLFGQVNPELFAQHMTYFLPYLKVEPEEAFDASRIDVMVLVCNLVAISSGFSRGLQQIEDHVTQLVSFDAPALTRAAIQLLVELRSVEQVASICEESFAYLQKLKLMIAREKGASPADIVKVISYNVLLKSAWKLGCVAEFADLGELPNKAPNWSQQLFDLLLELSSIFYNARLYNVAGMLVQCIARVFMNLKNISRIDFKAVRTTVVMFEEEAMIICMMMLVYQLLINYRKLDSGQNSGEKPFPVEKMRYLQNEIFCCLGTFVDAFVKLVAIGEDYRNVIVATQHLDLVMAMEICNMIFVNRLTNPEQLVPFVFCQVVSRDSNIQRIAEQALKVLAKNDPDIFTARLATSLHALLFVVIVGSFVDSVRVRKEDVSPRDSIGKRKSVESIGSDVGERSTKRRISTTETKGCVTDLSTGLQPSSPRNARGENQLFILGYESESTGARVRGVVRIFLEAVSSAKHSKKLVSILMGQLGSCLEPAFRDVLTTVVESHAIKKEDLQNITAANTGKLPKLLMKQLSTARNGDSNGLVNYFSLLYVEVLATVLEHVTVRDAKITKFFTKLSTELLKQNRAVFNESLSKYRDSRVTSLVSKIKQFQH